MVPTPTPAPPMPIQAMPAPMSFAAAGSMEISLSSPSGDRASMPGVYRIVEIDAGENGEDIGLQETHQQFKGGERDRHAERQDRSDPAEDPERAQHGHEAGKHLQGDVAGQDIGEQAQAVGDRTRQEREYLDGDQQGQDIPGSAA